jgi:hypothetical protein
LFFGFFAFGFGGISKNRRAISSGETLVKSISGSFPFGFLLSVDSVMTHFSEDYEPLYSALGKIVYAWAYLENIIDICVDIVYHVYGGNSIAHRQEIPRSLRIKIDFLKKSLKTITQLKQYKTEGLALINRVTPLSNLRHDMIHSICYGEFDNSYAFTKYDYGKTDYKIRDLEFTLDDYLQVGNKMMDLADEFEQFAYHLHYSKVRP